MSAIADFLKSVLPAALTPQSLAKIAETVARGGLTAFRHPQTQAGITLPEDGRVELRSGLGDSESWLVLREDGAVLHCPSGLTLTGSLYVSTPPSQQRFAGLSFDEFWEDPAVAVGYVPDPTIEVMVLPPGATEPTPVPLGQLIPSLSLYTQP